MGSTNNNNKSFDTTPYDPEEVVICPYYREHQMPAKRLPYHMKKCYERFGGDQYTNCPMNRRHVVRTSEFSAHLLQCPNKNIILKLTEEIPEEFYIKQSKADPVHVVNAEDEWGNEPEYSKENDTQHNPTQQGPIDIHPSLVNSPISYIYKLPEEIHEIILNGALKFLPDVPLNMRRDFKSLLNIYCQISRVKNPSYFEVSDHKHRFGNYASKCMAFNRNFYSSKMCYTIMQSQQDASMWALLFAFIKYAPKEIYEEFSRLEQEANNQLSSTNNSNNNIGGPAFRNA